MSRSIKKILIILVMVLLYFGRLLPFANVIKRVFMKNQQGMVGKRLV